MKELSETHRVVPALLEEPRKRRPIFSSLSAQIDTALSKGRLEVPDSRLIWKSTGHERVTGGTAHGLLTVRKIEGKTSVFRKFVHIWSFHVRISEGVEHRS